jgi:3-hydroxybutyryl-CoA dehydrogenase
MGAGIAQVAAERGLAVVLVDRDEDIAAKGKAKIAAVLSKLVDKGKLSAEKREAQLGLIVPAGSYAALGLRLPRSKQRPRTRS